MDSSKQSVTTGHDQSDHDPRTGTIHVSRVRVILPQETC